MQDPPDIPDGVSPQTVVAVGVIALAVLGLWIVSQGTSGLGVALFAGVVQVLVGESIRVGLWLAGAAGWGRAVWRAAGGARGQWAVAMALGVGTMAMWDWSLGVAGWLNVNTAWAVTGGGWALLAMWAYRRREQWYQRPERWPTLPWAIVLAVPALALLIGACACPPGMLWDLPSEARGYDVLSYHLQLPKEWIAAGAIQGLHHNAYSYLPSLFEAAYMHLGLWSGSMIGASYAAQLLHASTAMIAAAAVAQIVIAHTAKPIAGAFAAAVYLALPWTIVTGSMAYNEQFIAALGVAAVGVAINRGRAMGFGHAWADAPAGPCSSEAVTAPTISLALRTGLVIGVLVGFATLGKLTAAGMFALPIALVLLARRDGGWPAWATRGIGAAIAGAALLGAYLIRNFVWTGNPTFPMFAEQLGTAHWSPEQAARWAAAHRPHAGFTQTLADLWHRGPADPQFAYVFWPAAIVALVLAIRDRRTRWAASMLTLVLAAQLAFWLAATHHQARFLLPMVGPACIGIGLGVGVWRWWHHAFRIAAGLAFITTLTAGGYGLYLTRHGAEAGVFIDGIELLVRPQRGQMHTPWAAINALPPGAKVYAEAWATPYYAVRPVDYQTVWDTSRLGAALAEGGVPGARAWMQRAGYTHVLIDWAMIDRWTAPGNYGYDPNITPRGLITFSEAALEPIHRWGAIVLYRVKPTR